ncbi:hypothetical protein VNO77_03451 [Canavalia gladiata]|uniref:Uncharacterized protein n=1 Tax=Canavalia gladiata TaxID=3824 RepID=A0AAN9MUX2_CANGL
MLDDGVSCMQRFDAASVGQNLSLNLPASQAVNYSPVVKRCDDHCYVKNRNRIFVLNSRLLHPSKKLVLYRSSFRTLDLNRGLVSIAKGPKRKLYGMHEHQRERLIQNLIFEFVRFQEFLFLHEFIRSRIQEWRHEFTNLITVLIRLSCESSPNQARGVEIQGLPLCSPILGFFVTFEQIFLNSSACRSSLFLVREEFWRESFSFCASFQKMKRRESSFFTKFPQTMRKKPRLRALILFL